MIKKALFVVGLISLVISYIPSVRRYDVPGTIFFSIFILSAFLFFGKVWRKDRRIACLLASLFLILLDTNYIICRNFASCSGSFLPDFIWRPLMFIPSFFSYGGHNDLAFFVDRAEYFFIIYFLTLFLQRKLKRSKS